jgi:DNA-binding transcriptional MerR regulator
MRIDELAHEAGVASTTVRLYQTKGLLPGPEVVGRTGFYGEDHLARLRLIHRLQSEGFSLAGIGRILDTWNAGRELADLVGTERELDALLAARRSVTLSPDELAGRLPPEVLDPDVLARAVDLGLVELTDDGRIRVPDERFIEVGRDVAALGVPISAILDEWGELTQLTDRIAARFVDVFETHLAPPGGLEDLDPTQVADLTRDLGRLQADARRIIEVAFDASLARRAAERLDALAGPTTSDEKAPSDRPNRSSPAR